MYGPAIAYIVTVYGERTGYFWSLIAFGLFTYPIWDHRLEELRFEGIEDFILEGIVMPVGVFLLCIYIGRIIVNSRKVTEETQRLYQQIVELHHQSEQTLAGFILAMSRAIESKDPYREGMSAERAVEELYKSCDIRYDRKLVDLFVLAMKERNYCLMTKSDFDEHFRKNTE
ncbi:hypothetical protein [Effusibacillus consociatus]|uniref:Uncharacterized protein n=1 Tax=Effusibacillus consociatus TaxID=1117041 RepID=A0ABV9Q3A9_9BACL